MLRSPDRRYGRVFPRVGDYIRQDSKGTVGCVTAVRRVGMRIWVNVRPADAPSGHYASVLWSARECTLLHRPFAPGDLFIYTGSRFGAVPPPVRVEDARHAEVVNDEFFPAVHSRKALRDHADWPRIKARLSLSSP